MNNPEQGPSDKQRRWEEIVGFMKEAVDMTGLEIDPEIVDTCAALTALGFRTTNSCSGHIDTDRPRFPYVRISAGAEPHEKFVGQTALRKRLAEKYGITEKEVEFEHTEAMHEHDLAYEDENYQETEEYATWCKKGEELQEKLRGLINEFAGEVQYHGTLRVPRFSTGSFEIETAEPSKFMSVKHATPDVVEEIKNAQADMLNFGKWLKKKYFQGV